MIIRIVIDVEAGNNVRAECALALIKKAKELLVEEKLYAQAASLRNIEREISIEIATENTVTP
jgi:ABC-type Fe3+/spermidine/putrescine transport system ATPase subunit